MFATHSTTKSPQKHHVCTPVFVKNPCKNANPPRQKNAPNSRFELATRNKKSPEQTNCPGDLELFDN
jgi:hypothetical protein